MNLQEKILAVGIENCIFMVPLKPLHSILGLIKYTSSNDKPIIWPCQISEKNYKIKENYKITLEPISYKDKLASETYYLSDLTQLIKSNYIQFYIKQSLTEKQ